MWREVLTLFVGVWLLIFASLDFESDVIDVSLTVYTGLVVLAIGLWGVWRIRQAAKQKRAQEAGKRVDLKAEPEATGVTLESKLPPDYRGLSRERDPTDLNRP